MVVTKAEVKDIKKIEAHDISGSVAGTTTDDYVEALDIDTRGSTLQMIILKNNHATNSLDYKVHVTAYYNGIELEKVAETALAAGASVELHYLRAYAQVKVLLKATVGSSQATYVCDYTHRGA
jgi:hypothetical protein